MSVTHELFVSAWLSEHIPALPFDLEPQWNDVANTVSVQEMHRLRALQDQYDLVRRFRSMATPDDRLAMMVELQARESRTSLSEKV